jgi:hypothetical protein
MKQPQNHSRNTRIGSSKQHQFSEVPHADIRRSKFDRSHGLKTSFSAGDLIPVFFDEALPGDSFSLNMTAFARLATPINPTMDNAFMDTHFFSVPVRLVWDDFQEFMGETKTYTNPSSSTASQNPDFTVAAPVMPTITSHAVNGDLEDSLSDYLGIPTKIPALEYSALWHRAYTLVWNDWFRDENLQNFKDLDTTSGPDTTTYEVLKRGKRHDYFTSALPWPQKGSDVLIPMGTTAPVVTDGSVVNFTPAAGPEIALNSAAGGSSNVFLDTNGAFPGGELLFGAQTGLQTDLTTATSVTINQLRLAFATQKFLEKQARGGPGAPTFG